MPITPEYDFNRNSWLNTLKINDVVKILSSFGKELCLTITNIDCMYIYLSNGDRYRKVDGEKVGNDLWVYYNF